MSLAVLLVNNFSDDDAAFIVGAKNSEEKDKARRVVQTQAELLRDFPEVVGAELDKGKAPGESSGANESDELSSLEKRLKSLENGLGELQGQSKSVKKQLDEHSKSTNRKFRLVEHNMRKVADGNGRRTA